jgi:hypothetical protein
MPICIARKAMPATPPTGTAERRSCLTSLDEEWQVIAEALLRHEER